MNQQFCKWLNIILISVLLLVFCVRIWDIGILHTDDALWALWAHQPGADPVGEFARSQGRLWAFPVGGIQLRALAWSGTLYGETLKLGSFVTFFVLFHIFVAIYFGRQIAMLSVCLFFAFFALRWEDSWLTAGGVGLWLLGSVFIVSMLLGRAYIAKGSPAFAISAGFCLFASLFANEGVSVLYASLFAFSILGNVFAYSNGRIMASDFIAPGRTRNLIIAYVLSTTCYLGLAVGWAQIHVSHYDGHTLAPFSFFRIVIVLFEFATSNFIIRDFLQPYSVNFSDPIAGTGIHAVYKPSTFLNTLIWYPAALMFGLISAFLFYRVIRRPGMTRPCCFREIAPALFAPLVGLAIAILPILPVSATAKYQQGHFDLGVNSYSTSILAYFGISLLLAALLSLAVNVAGSALRTTLTVVLTLMIGVSAAISDRMNDAIAIDMRPESGRWRVLSLALESVKVTRTDIDAIWAPRFWNGSWFTAVPTTYWSDYAEALYRSDIRFLKTASAADQLGRTAYLDYLLADDHRSFILYLARLAAVDTMGSRRTIADKIIIGVENPTLTGLRNHWLTFIDDQGKPQQFELEKLRPLGPDAHVWILDNILAVPGSIQISNHSVIGTLPIACAASIPLNSTIHFGQRGGGTSQACIGTVFLQSGWSTPERDAVWSVGKQARLAIPLASPPLRNIILSFDLSTYVGLGFYRGTQTVRVSVNGRAMETWTFTTGQPPPNKRIVVPSELVGSSKSLDIAFEIYPPFNPKILGIAQDDRDLGISLRSVTIEQDPNS